MRHECALTHLVSHDGKSHMSVMSQDFPTIELGSLDRQWIIATSGWNQNGRATFVWHLAASLLVFRLHESVVIL